MKAVILSRVSSREQEEGHSISAQLSRLQEYCKRRNLDIIKEYQIVESSTRGERKKFHEMLEFVEAQNEIIAIVADAVDRIQRSFKESVLLDELLRKDKIELHFIRESLVLNKESKSTDIMRWDFSVMGAKTYILNMRDNVKRSLDYKVERGEWIGKAPIGYINAPDAITGKNTLLLDKDRAYLIKRAFEDFSTGNYSLMDIVEKLKKQGFTSKAGAHNPLTKSQVHLMLHNPFYCGYMVIKGKTHKHKYETIIDEALFRKCQEVFQNYHKKPFRYGKKEFIFRGLIKCDYCGCTISPYIKKNKYVYLSCSKYKGNCPSVIVREEELLEQVKKTLKTMVIPKELLSEFEKYLKASHDAKKEFHNDKINSLHKEYTTIQSMLDKLLDMNLRQSITQDEYDTKASQLKQRQYDINEQLKQYTVADEQFSITLSYLVNLASRSYELFESSKVMQKRQLLNFLLLNSTLRGRKLKFSLKTPFNLFPAIKNRSRWLGDLDLNQDTQLQRL